MTPNPTDQTASPASELLPCPFCGRQPEVLQHSAYGLMALHAPTVEDERLGKQCPVAQHGRAFFAHAWNTRPIEASERDARSKAEAEVERQDATITAKSKEILSLNCRLSDTGRALYTSSTELASARQTIAELREALEEIRTIFADRQGFVMMGPLAFVRAEVIAIEALAASEPGK